MLWTLLTLLGWATCSWGACSYPSDLIGEWYSTSFGTLTFTSTSFSGFTSDISATALTFTCELAEGSKYVSKSSVQLFVGVTVDVYLCMNLQQITTIKYLFTLDSNRDSNSGLRFITSSSTPTVSDACTYTDTRSDGEYELLILAANLTDAFVSCPVHLQTLFDVNMTSQSVSNCNGSSLDGRITSTSLVFNYSSCATGTFNAGGYISCLYYSTSDFTYVNTYNNDTSVDGTSTYRFTCFVYSKDQATLLATEYPGSCHYAQTSTSVDSPGINYTMTDLLFVAEDTGDTDYTVIIVIVVCSVVIVIIVVLLVILYCKLCIKPKPQPPPPKIRKPKRKLSVTDYSPRVSRSPSVEKGIPVNKKTAGEIITGIQEHNKNTAFDGEEYEPPKKKVWQKKWETKLRPSTPTTIEQRGKVGKLSLENLAGFKQKMGISSSLPDNLDKTSEENSQISKDTNKPASLDNLRYSERLHAFSKLPDSTGKFGSSPRSKLQASIISALDSTLDTIKENPLSRESTAASFSKSTVGQRRTADGVTSLRSDRSSLSTAMTSKSTASARDVHLTSLQSLSRGSHLSASMASIFDDPTWLSENTKKTETFFDVVKNLIPGLPKRKGQDQTWFMKSQQNSEISREDIDYFRNRNKRTVGINGLDTTRSSTSTSIIENEKKRQLKRTKIKPKIVRPTSPHFED